MIRKSKISRILGITLLAIVTGIFVNSLFAMIGFSVLLWTPHSNGTGNPRKEQRMYENIMRFGGLAPLLETAKIIDIETGSNLFNHNHRLKFEADNDSIRRWLKASHVVKKYDYPSSDGTEEYNLNIKDCEYGEAKVDYKKHEVFVQISE